MNKETRRGGSPCPPLDYLVPDWPAPANVAALTTLRQTGDAYLQQLPSPPVWLKQVHGTKVICADNLLETKPEADASYACQPSTVCVVNTADCLPIIICDQNGTQVAVMHAGWRGLAAGIVATTCATFTMPLQKCMAWIGPAIGPQAFEVQNDVIESFGSQGWSQKHISQAFIPKADTPDKFLGDLVYLAKITLQQQGILADNIYGGEWCTYSDPARFYSYRRSVEGGRMSTLIWIK
jgi:YfiH family protein